MHAAADLMMRFVFIPQYWSRWARTAFFVVSPITFPLWLVGLALWMVVRTLGYVLLLMIAMVSLALTESGVISHFFKATVRTGGVDGFDVLPNGGRVSDASASRSSALTTPGE